MKEADLTKVSIVRDDLSRTIVDLSTPERRTDAGHNIVLRNGDSIEVPLAFKGGFVSISGEVVKAGEERSLKTTKTPDGKYEITIDTTALDDDMKKWAEEKLRPVCETWYPKIVEMLPSEGYDAPAKFGIVFKDDMGGTPAAASGTSWLVRGPMPSG
jgi:hypothetical protein